MPNIFQGPSGKMNWIIAGAGLITVIGMAFYVAVVTTGKNGYAGTRSVPLTEKASRRRLRPVETPRMKDNDFFEENALPKDMMPDQIVYWGTDIGDQKKQPRDGDMEITTGKPTTTA